MHLLIISGRSGSGKTISLDVLEDLGYYCIDNLPLRFIENLSNHMDESMNRVAVSIDARNLPSELSLLKETISNLKHSKQHCEIVYLDAKDSVLVKRFSETRRRHPLTKGNLPLKEAMQQESSLLLAMAELADFSIDTSNLTSHQLKQLIKDHFQSTTSQLQVLVQSFGFKKGIPSEADYVFDVRCLPNPYWQPDLRPYSGLDAPVAQFLESQPIVKTMLTSLEQFLSQWIPAFREDNRSYLTFAIGCTGGQHRSVYCANYLSHKLSKENYGLIVRHRDMAPHKDTVL